MLLRSVADTSCYTAYHSLGFSRYCFISHQEFRSQALMADKCYVMEEMGLTQLAQVVRPFLTI